MNTTTQQSDYSSLLDSLREIHNTDTFEVNLPSSHSKITLRKLKLDQQRDIIQSATNDALSTLMFSIALAKIIKNNHVGDECVLVTDIPVIAMSLRHVSMSSSIVVNGVDIDLASHLNNIKNIKMPKDLLSTVITSDIPGSNKVVSIKCQVPTLDMDSSTNKECLQVIREKLSNEDDVADSIGNVIMYEFIKYIGNISIEDVDTGENIQYIDFNKLKNRQKITIIETLSAELNTKLTGFIKKVTDFTSSLTRLTIDGTEVDIEITPNIFISDK